VHERSTHLEQLSSLKAPRPVHQPRAPSFPESSLRPFWARRYPRSVPQSIPRTGLDPHDSAAFRLPWTSRAPDTLPSAQELNRPPPSGWRATAPMAFWCPRRRATRSYSRLVCRWGYRHRRRQQALAASRKAHFR